MPSRLPILEKVVRPPSNRQILVIPFDKHLPNISVILKHRWQCLVDKDHRARDYKPKPPMVTYSRSKSFKDIICRSKHMVPPPSYRMNSRQATLGLKKCDKRADCSVCLHSVNINSTSHTCNFSSVSYDINYTISCLTPGTVYTVSCTKMSGECSRVNGLQYTIAWCD